MRVERLGFIAGAFLLAWKGLAAGLAAAVQLGQFEHRGVYHCIPRIGVGAMVNNRTGSPMAVGTDQGGRG